MTKKPARQSRITPLIVLAIFAIAGVLLLATINAANPNGGAAVTNGIKAAGSPKEALGVSGTPSTVFATWLGREDIRKDIKFGESNAHFNPSSIDSKIKNAATTTSDKTLVVTISATPENNTNFMPDTTKNNQLCGLVGDSKDATQHDYFQVAGTYKLNGQPVPLARANLKAAKHDENENGIKDNIEHLYRATKGCFDNTYRHIADSIVKHKAYEYLPDGRPKLIIRFGHEHDGDFYEWSSTNQTSGNVAAANALTGGKSGNQLYKETWQRAVSLINDRVADKVSGAKVSWEFNVRYKAAQGGSRTLIENTYPGDQYVDVIGIDFYDRVYGSGAGNSNANCFLVVPGEQVVPDCRSDTEKRNAWNQTELMLNTLSDFAAEHGKVIGVSEQAISTAQATVDGKKYWEQGGDNAYYVQKSYDWVKDQTTNKGRLAYYVIFERNGVNASKELGTELGAEGLKSIHKMTPGADNRYQLPSGNRQTTCALKWDYIPLDDDREEIPGEPARTHLSRFPKSATKFLELWSGPIDGGASTHANCKELFTATVPADNFGFETEESTSDLLPVEDSGASNGQYIEYQQQ